LQHANPLLLLLLLSAASHSTVVLYISNVSRPHQLVEDLLLLLPQPAGAV
jgi:hypothetical protein